MSERFSVVELSGIEIVVGRAKSRGNFKTDYHVVDERGRTMRVFSNPPKPARCLELPRLRRSAERYAAELNAKAAGERIAT